jgi:hypothetical protein
MLQCQQLDGRKDKKEGKKIESKKQKQIFKKGAKSSKG